MKSPAFRFYADDFLAGTLEMTQEEVGAYIRLLCHQWNRGSIPVEPEKQQRLAGGSVSADVLAKFPRDENGLLKNQRLEREREKQSQFSESQRLKGKKSAEARRTGVEPGLNRGSTEGSTEIQPSVSVSVSASVSSSKTPCSPPTGDGAQQEQAGEQKEPKPSDIVSVKLYAQEISLPLSEACAFWDHFESNGWKVGGKTPMKDWKAALRNWQRNAKRFGNRQAVEKPKHDMSQYF